MDSSSSTGRPDIDTLATDDITPRIWWSATRKKVIHNHGYVACLKIIRENTPKHWEVIRELGDQFMGMDFAADDSVPTILAVGLLMGATLLLYNLVRNVSESFTPRCSGCRNKFGRLLVYLDSERVLPELYGCIEGRRFSEAFSILEDCKFVLGDNGENEHSCVHV